LQKVRWGKPTDQKRRPQALAPSSCFAYCPTGACQTILAGGGAVLVRAPVREIIVDNGVAKGVLVENAGQLHPIHAPGTFCCALPLLPPFPLPLNNLHATLLRLPTPMITPAPPAHDVLLSAHDVTMCRSLLTCVVADCSGHILRWSLHHLQQACARGSATPCVQGHHSPQVYVRARVLYGFVPSRLSHGTHTHLRVSTSE
jgi:hypothetical protein